MLYALKFECWQNHQYGVLAYASREEALSNFNELEDLWWNDSYKSELATEDVAAIYRQIVNHADVLTYISSYNGNENEKFNKKAKELNFCYIKEQITIFPFKI